MGNLSKAQVIERFKHCKENKLDFVTLKKLNDDIPTRSTFHQEVGQLVKSHTPIVDLTKK